MLAATRLVSICMAAAVLIAGCARGDGGGTPKSEGGLLLAGRVVDDQQLPIANATVALAQRKDNAPVSSTNSSIDGAFSLGRVPIGTYVLTIASTAYEPLVRNVDVIEGRETHLSTMTFTLTAVPVIEPYHETVPKTVQVQYGVAYQINGDFNQGCMEPAYTCNAISYPATNTQFEARDPKHTPWMGVVFEEFWTSTSPICAKAIAVDIYNPDAPNSDNPNQTNPHYWTNYPSKKWQLSSPIKMVIPRAEDDNRDAVDAPWRVEANGGKMLVRGNWTVRNFPPGKGVTNLLADVNCITDQKFELYWTNFYLEAPPVSFSARPS